ncbi:MAG: hypothetical protein LAP40_00270 [Acidobacteriia bacterium]|nr:hypothetical protein [Terriglobia bacterium]
MTNGIWMTGRLKAFLLLGAAGMLGGAAFAQPYQPVEIAFNLADSSKLAVLPGGSFLTVEAGTRTNHGSLLFFDSQGDYTRILLGLPSPGRYPWSTTLSGPDGLAVLGNTLYLATPPLALEGAPPPSNTQASILRVTFSRNLSDLPGPFFLLPADYQTLLSGSTVTLSQSADNTATVSLLASATGVPSDLSVDAGTGRLYIVFRANHTISWVPLQ